MKNTTALTVYKASAGSGKTYRLAVEYIKQLVKNPKAYETILAVTFTNKATEEMKMRILSQLYGLAKKLPSSNGYLKTICNELVIDGKPVKPDFVASQAAEALKNMLHSYSSFRVQTIDTFFQTVLRNLARELNLTPNLKVELNDREVESKAVDELIENLHLGDDVLNWILDYVGSNLDDDKDWNVISSVKKFGKQLLRDEYKMHSDAINLAFSNKDEEGNFFDKFKKTLRGIIKQEDLLKSKGQELVDKLAGNGYTPGDLTKNIKGYVSRMPEMGAEDAVPTKTVLDAVEADMGNAKSWVTAKAPADLRELAISELKPILKEYLDMQARLLRDVRSAKITLSHLSELRLLQAIRSQIEAGNRENDRFLLSDTQTLLGKMIEGSDTPFIYEKIGTRLRQIMIDEFQDTSRIQWQNFKVLLADCMSHSNDSLIVGDVKQSIYRWRSGDWRLLNNIKKEFPHQVEDKTLSRNFRSTRGVIDFNNAFFRNASRLVCNEEARMMGEAGVEQLRRAFAYSTLMQKTAPQTEDCGLVEATLLPNNKDFDYTGGTLKKISETVAMLKAKNYKDSDIAIIVRKNKQIPLIAEYLNKELPDVNIVSDEAFSLKSSDAVMIIINALRLLVTPTDPIIMAMLMTLYQKAVCGNETEASTLILQDMESLLPEAFVEKQQELVQLPLYQLAESLYEIFSLAKLDKQNSYVSTLFDYINDFVNRSPASIPNFLQHWDESLVDKNIESDSNDGLRILTIHKSKGLEYANVICPFVDWTFIPGSDATPIIWSHSDEAPYSSLPLIPLDYSSKLEGTVYADDYHEEHMQMAVDNLNLLYVAFTRASRNLFIITKQYGINKSGGRATDNSTRAPLVVDCLEMLHEQKEAEVIRLSDEEVVEEKLIEVAKDEAENGIITYTHGTFAMPKIEEEGKKDAGKGSGGDVDDEEKNVFEVEPEPMFIGQVTAFNRQPEFKQSNASREFTETDEDQQQRTEYIQLGNILHNLMSQIGTEADVPKALLDLQMKGLLYGQDITVEEVEARLQRCFRNPDIKRWFSPGWRLYNECTILEQDGDKVVSHRPDRVIMSDKETIVIDFKLNMDKTGYHDQVKRYMRLLREMGYPNVSGYLLFLMPGKTVKVEE